MDKELYKGIIIEESLVNKEVLNQMKITKTVISKSLGWTMRWVQCTKEDIFKIKLNSPAWYCHFYMGEQLIVVFMNKIFDGISSDKSTWKDAVAYGLQSGIPANQLNFIKG